MLVRPFFEVVKEQSQNGGGCLTLLLADCITTEEREHELFEVQSVLLHVHLELREVDVVSAEGRSEFLKTQSNRGLFIL